MILLIDGFDDRRIIAGIIADNGYKVKIVKKFTSKGHEAYYIVEIDED